jgi:hypothetical protein
MNTTGRSILRAAVPVICLASMLAACGTSQPVASSLTKPTLLAAAAKSLATKLTSPDPKLRQQGLVPQLAAQVGSASLLEPGTTLHIDSATFKAKGPTTGTVQATSTGTEAGRWTLYLVLTNGVWQLVEADPS